MKKFGIYPNFKSESFAEKYLRINEIITYLANSNGLSLFQIDEVWWKVVNGSLPFDEENKSEQTQEE